MKCNNNTYFFLINGSWSKCKRCQKIKLLGTVRTWWTCSYDLFLISLICITSFHLDYELVNLLSSFNHLISNKYLRNVFNTKCFSRKRLYVISALTLIESTYSIWKLLLPFRISRKLSEVLLTSSRLSRTFRSLTSYKICKTSSSFSDFL